MHTCSVPHSLSWLLLTPRLYGYQKPLRTVVDPGVVCLVRSNPPDPKPTSSNNMVLDVKLHHYFGSLGLVHQSYNQETYRFFRRLSSGCTKCDRKGAWSTKFFACFARTITTPLHNILHPPLQAGCCIIASGSALGHYATSLRFLKHCRASAQGNNLHIIVSTIHPYACFSQLLCTY